MRTNGRTDEDLSTKLVTIVSNLERRFDQLSNVCGLSVKSSFTAAATLPPPPVARHDRSKSATCDNRAQDVVICGNPKDRSTAIWRGKIEKVLSCAAGRDGKYSADKTRPLPVKLRSAWVRRLVLIGTLKLYDVAEYRTHVHISPDESFQTRRKNTLERLKSRAIRVSSG